MIAALSAFEATAFGNGIARNPHREAFALGDFLRKLIDKDLCAVLKFGGAATSPAFL